MEAKELRIGNYVSYLGEPQEVLGMDKMQVYIKPFNFVLYVDIDEIEPIPLTEEWLLNFGFENCENKYWFEKGILSLNTIGNISILGRKESEAVINSNVKHVHQLQNIYFALTGEELKLI